MKSISIKLDAKMSFSGKEIITMAQTAFARRSMPKDRIISSNFDLSHHIEASRVDEYIRKNLDIIDRSNSALVAFNYLTAPAAIWIVPKYIESTISHFEDDDFMLALLAGALASGVPGGKYTAQKDIGLRMRKLATDDEAKSICLYIKWLQNNTSEIGIDETLEAGISLWCS